MAAEEHNLPMDRSREDGEGATIDVEELGRRYLEEATESGHLESDPDHIPVDEPIDEVLDDLTAEPADKTNESERARR